MYSLNCLIGTGNTADVYDIGDNKVVKLFYKGYNYDSIVHEYNNSKLLNELNINIPKSYGLITFDDRHGIIYDKITGKSLEKTLLETLEIEKNTEILYKIHNKLLEMKLPGAINIKTILYDNITKTNIITCEKKVKLLQMLNELPDGDNLCHGDFHFGNVLVSGNSYYVIDFMNICKGNKLYDIARTFYLIERTPVPDDIADSKEFLQLKKHVASKYLSCMELTEKDIQNWLIIVSAARLYELRDNQITEINSIMHFLSEHIV